MNAAPTTNTVPTTHRPARLAALAVILPTAVLLTAGCASRPSSASSAGADAAVPSAAALGNTGNAQNSADRVAAAPATEDEQRQVISTGRIELVSGDVAAARVRVDAVLARLGGQVGDEKTTTDDHGTVTRSYLVVRIPSARFDRAMSELSAVASLRNASRQAQDVTTRVIDLGARIAAERAGVRRLRHLVSHTASLRALLDVERALTDRQGQLESLRQQQAYLADQTSQATITVEVTRRVVAVPVAASAGGFVGGLRHGWHALVTVVAGFLVGLGALLPFAVAGALVGVPCWLVVRRVLRTRRLRAPAES